MGDKKYRPSLYTPVLILYSVFTIFSVFNLFICINYLYLLILFSGFSASSGNGGLPVRLCGHDLKSGQRSKKGLSQKIRFTFIRKGRSGTPSGGTFFISFWRRFFTKSPLGAVRRFGGRNYLDSGKSRNRGFDERHSIFRTSFCFSYHERELPPGGARDVFTVATHKIGRRRNSIAASQRSGATYCY